LAALFLAADFWAAESGVLFFLGFGLFQNAFAIAIPFAMCTP